MNNIQAKHTKAGERYRAAVNELHDSMIDLAAIDRIRGTPSFGVLPDAVSFQHPIFAPDVSGHWPSDVGARIDAINNE